MKPILKAILLASLYISSTSHMSLATDWSYSGKTGPNNWSKLEKEFSACGLGKNQSPVDISKTYKYGHAPIEFKYKQASNSLYFSDHGMAVNFSSGSVNLDGHVYQLQGLHFHSPSEHHIAGKSYPLEAHFVNADKNGNLAVVSVLFRKGVENKYLKILLENAPEKKWKYSIRSFDKLMAEQLLPRKKDYFHLNGSLTTPPCSEGVLWLVMQRQVTVSAGQIEQLKDVLHAPNNRPIQPLNSRIITR